MLTKLVKYTLYDLLKSMWILAIFLFYAFTVYMLVKFGKSIEKVVISYSNLSSLTLSLFSVLLSTAYIYNNKNFLEFILSQPVKRSTFLISATLSLSLSLGISYLLGSLLSFYYLVGHSTSFLKSVMLNLSLVPSFVCLGVFSFLVVEDRVKGLGFSLFLWLFFCFLYDAIVLYSIVALSEYPVEKLIFALTFLNPLDLLRLIVLMDVGVYELMGFVGKRLAEYLKNLWFLPVLLSLFYTILLLLANLNIFKRRDF